RLELIINDQFQSPRGDFGFLKQRTRDHRRINDDPFQSPRGDFGFLKIPHVFALGNALAPIRLRGIAQLASLCKVFLTGLHSIQRDIPLYDAIARRLQPSLR
ncbi:MAG: hypothetical protein ACK44M_07980, partial [Chloroflexus sp.]